MCHLAIINNNTKQHAFDWTTPVKKVKPSATNGKTALFDSLCRKAARPPRHLPCEHAGDITRLKCKSPPLVFTEWSRSNNSPVLSVPEQMDRLYQIKGFGDVGVKLYLAAKTGCSRRWRNNQCSACNLNRLLFFFFMTMDAGWCVCLSVCVRVCVIT